MKLLRNIFLHDNASVMKALIELKPKVCSAAGEFRFVSQWLSETLRTSLSRQNRARGRVWGAAYPGQCIFCFDFIYPALAESYSWDNPESAATPHSLPSILPYVLMTLWAFEAAIQLPMFKFWPHPGQCIDKHVSAWLATSCVLHYCLLCV